MNTHHIGINVKELENSKIFYQTHFDFREEFYLEMESETILFLSADTIRLELIHDSVTRDNHSAKVHFAWGIKSIGEKMEELKHQGLLPIEGPIQLPNGWQVVFYSGPDGEMIELVECNDLT